MDKWLGGNKRQLRWDIPFSFLRLFFSVKEKGTRLTVVKVLGESLLLIPGVKRYQYSPLVHHTSISGWVTFKKGFLGNTGGKEPVCKCRRRKRHRFDPWVGKIPWKRLWQPTPVLLPGESQGQRSLTGYSLYDHKSWTRLKQLSTAQHNIQGHRVCNELMSWRGSHSLGWGWQWLVSFTPPRL